MSNPKTEIFCITEEQYVNAKVVLSKNCFHVNTFRQYGNSFDPAGLCDGGDYERDLKIELKPDNTISLSWRNKEYDKLPSDGHNYFHGVPYEKFFDALLKYLPEIRKECIGQQ